MPVDCQSCGAVVPDGDWPKHQVEHWTGARPILSAIEAFLRHPAEPERRGMTLKERRSEWTQDPPRPGTRECTGLCAALYPGFCPVSPCWQCPLRDRNPPECPEDGPQRLADEPQPRAAPDTGTDSLAQTDDRNGAVKHR